MTLSNQFRKSNKFLILRRGCFYEPDMKNLENQLFSILRKTENSENTGILTTSNRRKWYQNCIALENGNFRISFESYLKKRVNIFLYKIYDIRNFEYKIQSILQFVDPLFVKKTQFMDGFLGLENFTNRVRQEFKKKKRNSLILYFLDLK